MDAIAMQEGFGQSTFRDIAELRKALQTGYTTELTSITGGQAMTVQSLDQTLKTITYTEEHIKLFKLLAKTDANALVDEWVERSAYGGEFGAFVGEMEAPEDTDTTLARKVGFVRFLRAIGKISHPMLTVRNIMDAEVQEVEAKTRWLLGVLEAALFQGDSAVYPEQFDGLFKLIADNAPNNVVDMRGKRFGDISNPETVFDEWAGYLVSAPNYAVPTHFFANPIVFRDIAEVFEGEKRIVINQNPSPQGMTGVAGIELTGYRSMYGYFNFVQDVFIRTLKEAPAAATGSKAPNAPSGTAAVNAGTDGSKWQDSDPTDHKPGDYWYYVTAVNKYGESARARVPAAGVATVAAGGDITLTITPAGDGETATGYRIYRTTESGDTPYLIKEVADSGGATTEFVDLNLDLPTTTKAALLDVHPGQTLDYRQLLPMIKIDVPFGVFGPVRAWYQMLYGYLRLIAPLKQLLVKNVGLPPVSLSREY